MEATICDYSLELYRSRPAQVEENLTLHRFPSGTLGFVGKSGAGDDVDKETACCLIAGATITLSGISEPVCKAFDLQPVEEATFTKLDVTGHAHKDALLFGNGRTVLLQSINPGARAQVTGNTSELDKVAPAVEATPDAVDAD